MLSQVIQQTNVQERQKQRSKIPDHQLQSIEEWLRLDGIVNQVSNHFSLIQRYVNNNFYM